MNYELATVVIGILVALTNIIVEVLKKIFPEDKFPTNILVVIVSMILSACAYVMYLNTGAIVFDTIHIIGVIVLGFAVAYAAMFGYDKLMQSFEQYRKLK